MQHENFGILQTIFRQLNDPVCKQILLKKVSHRIPKFGPTCILRKSYYQRINKLPFGEYLWLPLLSNLLLKIVPGVKVQENI